MRVSEHIFSSEAYKGVVERAIEKFLTLPRFELPPEPFEGAGVYAIFYNGSFPLYSKIKKQSRPIYVGKTAPPGWRTGRQIDIASSELTTRLRQHARSIESTHNLILKDFSCTFMILSGEESDLISTIEAHLIRRYQPLWNVAIDGFGNHDPGKGRYNQAPSEWDTLHPGRVWATRLTGNPPLIEKIEVKAKSILDTY